MGYSANPDIEYYQNNGVLAVRPVRGGRLNHLVKLTMGGKECVWVFADLFVYKGDYGEEMIDHHTRGLTVGTFGEGGLHLSMCSHLGFRVENRGFFVPLSNGQRRHLTDKNGRASSDYEETEIALCRVDLPTLEQLQAILKK